MKKRLILLPIIMMALAGCGTGGDSESINDESVTSTNTSNSNGNASTPSSIDPNLPSGVMHNGTEDDPFTVADAILVAKKTGETATTTNYFVKGIVTKVDASGAAQFGNLTIDIKDPGDSNSFTAYRILGLRGEKFTSETAEDVEIGSTIVVTGPIVNFKGNTPEISGSGAHLVSIDASTVPEKVEYRQVYSLSEDKVYKLGISLEGKEYFINGKMGGYENYYMDTTSFFNEGIDVKVEINGDSYFMYHTTNGQKKYLDLVESDGHKNAVYVDTKPEIGFLFDQDNSTLYKEFDNVGYYIGSKDSYTTLAGYSLNVDNLNVAHFFEEGKKEPIPVTGIEVEDKIEVRLGRTVMLNAKVIPSYADDQELIFESLDEEVATVTNDGKVKGISLGDTQIVIKAHEDDSITKTIDVTVVELPDDLEKETATFTFENALDEKTTKATELKTSETALSAFHSVDDVMPISALNLSKFYAGANGGSGDNTFVLYDVIKLGTTSAGGTIDLVFDDDVFIEKVVVKMASWAASNTLTINDITQKATVTKVNGDTVPEDVEYALEEVSNVLQFSASKAIVIWALEITYTR